MLELGQEAERIFPRLPAEFLRGLIGNAHRRTAGHAMHAAAVVLCQLPAPDARRLAAGHAGYRRRERRGDAAGTAPSAAGDLFQRSIPLILLGYFPVPSAPHKIFRES
jgi:hypothetical protein